MSYLSSARRLLPALLVALLAAAPAHAATQTLTDPADGVDTADGYAAVDILGGSVTQGATDTAVDVTLKTTMGSALDRVVVPIDTDGDHAANYAVRFFSPGSGGISEELVSTPSATPTCMTTKNSTVLSGPSTAPNGTSLSFSFPTSAIGGASTFSWAVYGMTWSIFEDSWDYAPDAANPKPTRPNPVTTTDDTCDFNGDGSWDFNDSSYQSSNGYPNQDTESMALAGGCSFPATATCGPATGGSTGGTGTGGTGTGGSGTGTGTGTGGGTTSSGPSAAIQNLIVTQGVQQSTLPALDSPQPATGPRQEAYPSNDVPLAVDGKTIVRVFVQSSTGAKVELNGSDDNTGASLSNPILPVNTGTPDLSATDAQVKQGAADGAYEFVLPAFWTRVKDLRLTANMIAGDGTTDTLVLHGIPFDKDATVNLRLVAMTDGGAMPPDPTAQLAQALNLVPESSAAAAPPTTTAATIEIGDLLHCPTCTNRNAVNASVFQRMRNWTNRNPAASANMSMAIAADARLGMSSGLIGSAISPASVVSITDRPYTTVAHELFHGLGMPHVGQACPLDAAGNPAIGNPSKAVAWPPDDRGYLHSVGLDRTTQDAGGFFPVIGGTPAQAYDLMSYCAPNGGGDPGDWASASDWDTAMVNLDALANGGRSVIGPTAMSSSAGGLAVQAFTVDGATSVPDVESSIGAPRPEGDPSGLVLRSTAAGGRRLPDAPLLATEGHVNRGSEVTFLEGTAPAGAASIAIVDHGRVLARRVRSPHPPAISALRAKVAGTGAARKLTVRWHATDRDRRDRLSARVDVGTGAARHTIYLGPNRNAAKLTGDAVPAGKRLRVRVTVGDGFNETRADATTGARAKRG